ncbi:hypothetical protein M9H77_17243 [Catharanthus roseus]|uniref:Uncharacterized protein n=1 Tax=Catharanthus roseus TaxID=4058 RepID=A0ACC0B418_CATRO|nr:hypothetical protein M9H77_17243 [Catharanthus roseus]
MRTRQYVVASTKNPDRRSDQVVSQLPKTLSMANFRAYHARFKTYDALRSMKASSLSFEQSRDWDPYLVSRVKTSPNELFLLQFHRHSHGIVRELVQKLLNEMTTHGICNEWVLNY